MNILKITYNSSTKFCLLKHGYNKRFDEFVRFGVAPTSYRKWSNDKKCWEVHITKLPPVVLVAKRLFDRVDWSELPEDLQIDLVSKLISEASASASRGFQAKKPVLSPYEALYLLPTAPMEVVKAAYRALAFIYHPDRGGDAEAFKDITKAYEEIVEQG
jgi:hypothetical protein